jgi:4'-phosphopantetheinyl transferase
MDLQASAMDGRAALAAGTVAVWRIPLVQPTEMIDACRALLSPDECRRADRYRFEPPRRRFTVTRAALRQCLAAILAADPLSLQLAAGPHGKPYLSAMPGLHFNVSHSHDAALCAITTVGPVGVDIEHIRPLRDADAIARHKFAPEEYAVWAALPDDQRLAAFFACWSRKEAFIKATGEGLYRPLSDFVVTLAPGEPAALLAVHSDPAAVAAWSYVPIPAPPGYATALLVQAPRPRLIAGDWRPC